MDRFVYSYILMFLYSYVLGSLDGFCMFIIHILIHIALESEVLTVPICTSGWLRKNKQSGAWCQAPLHCPAGIGTGIGMGIGTGIDGMP